MSVFRTPQSAFKSHALAWALGHLLFFGLFLAGISLQYPFAIRIGVWGMAGWSPLIGLCGYKAVFRAWKREPEDALADVSIPALAVIGTVGLAYFLVH